MVQAAVMDSLTCMSIHIDVSRLKNPLIWIWESLEKECRPQRLDCLTPHWSAENDRAWALLNFKSTIHQYQLQAGLVISRDYGT